MHVVLFTNSFPSNENPAAGAFVREQALTLNKLGIKVGVISVSPRKLTQRQKTQTLPSYPFPVLYSAFFNILPFTPYYIQYKISGEYNQLLKKYIKLHGKPDLIHAHFGLWAGYAAGKANKKFNIPYVVTEHTTYFFQKKHSPFELKLFSRLYDRAAGIIAVSDNLKTAVQELSNNKNIDTIHNMVDVHYFKPADTQKSETIFSLGNLSYQKGFDYLLQAFALFNKKHPKVGLRIGGDGPLKEDLKKLASRLGIEKSVHFTGSLTKEKVLDELHNARLFALASRFETFGVVFIEAISCGIPVVATKSGGPEGFVNKENGILCEPGDIKCLAEAMTSLYENTYLYPAENLHEFAVENFSARSIGKQIINFYRKSINQNG